MYSLLALLSGIVLTAMIQADGELGARFGVYHAALYTHIVGVAFAALVLAAQRSRVTFSKKTPVWMYLGGVIGVLTTVFSNIAFLHISLTGIVALELFAQLVFSALIDVFGWLGMKRQDRADISISGILLSLLGIALMAGDASGDGMIYILLALASGVTVVLSRIVNSHLAQQIGELQGSFVNHLAGMPFCLLLTAVIPESPEPSQYHLWAWGGGILGVMIVLLFNLTVPRLPACRLTLLTFCGQLFSGILLDVLLNGTLNRRELAAGLLISAGVALSRASALYKQRKRRERSRAEIC